MPGHHLWVRFLKNIIMCVIILLILLGVLAYWLTGFFLIHRASGKLFKVNNRTKVFSPGMVFSISLDRSYKQS
jgi:hypothetical protein